MSTTVQTLATRLEERFSGILKSCVTALGEVTIEVPSNKIKEVCFALRDEVEFGFDQIIDLCGVDYAAYGVSEWQTADSSAEGFSRGVERHVSGKGAFEGATWKGDRFAVVYHLLSVKNNQRLRVRALVDEKDPRIDTVVDVWNCADWFEREAFDLYGILFEGHPDLRRLLTDYGFIGHPFRKDFPLLGNVEMRYDEEKGRVVYEPVETELRVLVPRVIRDTDASDTAEEK